MPTQTHGAQAATGGNCFMASTGSPTAVTPTPQQRSRTGTVDSMELPLPPTVRPAARPGGVTACGWGDDSEDITAGACIFAVDPLAWLERVRLRHVMWPLQRHGVVLSCFCRESLVKTVAFV